MSIQTGSEAGFGPVARFLAERAGLASCMNRQTSFEAGIAKAMNRAGIASPRDYVVALEAQDSLLDDLLAEVTIGETYFFREPHQIDFLRREILPGLVRQRDSGTSLRIWSAGCASGEEPYSLAIILEQEGLAGRAHILATDISRDALGRARNASYGAWSLRESDESFKTRYFVRERDRYRLVKRFRECVTFEYQNLALDSYPSFAFGIWGMDLILCRNVLIYLDEPTIRRVARGFYDSLAEGGWLVTGPSDPLLTVYAPFTAVVTDAGVFLRRLPDLGIAVPPPPAPTAARPPPASPRPSTTEPSPPNVPDDAALTAARAALHVKELANSSGTAKAQAAASEAVVRFPLSAELQLLNAVLLIGLGRDEDAASCLRRVLYLDRSLAAAHFVLGSLLVRRGETAAARTAFRNARDLASGKRPDEVLSFSDGETAGRLLTVATAELALLDLGSGAPA